MRDTQAGVGKDELDDDSLAAALCINSVQWEGHLAQRCVGVPLLSKTPKTLHTPDGWHYILRTSLRCPEQSKIPRNDPARQRA